MKEIPELRNIAREYGSAIQAERLRLLLDIIEKNTYKVNGVAVPSKGSLEFQQLPISIFPDDKEFANKVTDIFRKSDNSLPQDVYVLSEEEVDNPEGLSKFAFDDFINRVVPYIFEWGALKNYWATDAENTTITFHQRGTAYWKKTRSKTP